MAAILCSCDSGESNISEDDNVGDDLVPVMGVPQTTTRKSGGGTKRVAFTFDDGPHNVYTKKIVDELDKYGYHATFFVVGNRVDGNAYNGGEAMKYAISHGNEIGIHGYTHTEYYDKCSDSVYKSELDKTASAIKKLQPSADIRLLRPVGGKISDVRVKESKYSVIMWSVDSEDWKYKYKSGDDSAAKKEKVDAIVNRVMAGVDDGSIILMHDIYESTYDAAKILIERLHSEGYEIVSVSELLGEKRASGKMFYSRAS